MKLTNNQLNNIKAITNALNNKKLTNKFLQAGILAVCYKESGLVPKYEIGYQTTPNSRIRQLFLATRNMTEAQINILKSNEKEFFNLVYGTNPYLGNKNTDDGYKYRGVGLNQLTGRANFEAMAKKTGIDIVNFPEKMLEIDTAATILTQYFYDSLIAGQSSGTFKSRFGIIRTAEIPSIHLGATIAHQCNMGWKYPVTSDVTGGYQTTIQYAPLFYNLINV